MNIRLNVESRDVYSLGRQVKTGRIVLLKSNDSVECKSLIIEKILIGLPVDTTAVENVCGARTVVDYILDNVLSFANDEFKLTGLSIFTEYNNKSYSELPFIKQARIDDFKIRVTCIQPPTDSDIVENILEKHYKK